LGYSQIYRVSPRDVAVPDPPPPGDVDRQKQRLLTEGQIEPLVLDINHQPDPDEYPYACAQVIAARDLEWPNILVVYHT
jgi:hypothetical protein